MSCEEPAIDTELVTIVVDSPKGETNNNSNKVESNDLKKKNNKINKEY